MNFTGYWLQSKRYEIFSLSCVCLVLSLGGLDSRVQSRSRFLSLSRQAFFVPQSREMLINKMIESTNSQSRQTVEIYQKYQAWTDFLIETFGAGRWCWDKIEISGSRFIDCQDKLFETVKIYYLPDKSKPPGLLSMIPPRTAFRVPDSTVLISNMDLL